MLRISRERTEFVALDSKKLVSLVKFVGDQLDNMVYDIMCVISQVTLGIMCFGFCTMISLVLGGSLGIMLYYKIYDWLN